MVNQRKIAKWWWDTKKQSQRTPPISLPNLQRSFPPLAPQRSTFVPVTRSRFVPAGSPAATIGEFGSSDWRPRMLRPSGLLIRTLYSYIDYKSSNANKTPQHFGEHVLACSIAEFHVTESSMYHIQQER
jgi:hypothetical protein